MHTIGILLLAAATTGDGFGIDEPHVGVGRKLFRHHAIASGPAAGAAATGCSFGHPGCAGGASCPGAAGMAGQSGRRFPNTRSQIFFLDPDDMKIGWQSAGANGERVYLPAQLTVPARYNFAQGFIYRLKLTDIPGRAGVQLYPTIEVAPSTPATDAYLTHNPIPVQFTAEDFDQVIDGGNFVTKVIYLPDPKYQELAIQGVETLVSTRLEPGVDPILEADKRGTILLIVRMGAIDLEMPSSGASVAPANAAAAPPAAGMGSPIVLPPGSVPPGVISTPGGPPVVPLETAPATPVVPSAPAATTPTPPTPAPAGNPPAANPPAANPPAANPPAANPPGDQALAPPPVPPVAPLGPPPVDAAALAPIVEAPRR
jgi:hypothetical protein